MRTAKTILTAAAFAIGAWGTAQAAQLPGPLVKGEWLVQNLEKVVVLDVRDKHEGVQFVPGSVAVAWKEVRAKNQTDRDGEVHDDLLPSKEVFEQFMKKLGVGNDSAVVIVTPGTSAGDVFQGARLYWQLKYFGHDNVALLDGGNALWLGEKRPTVPQPRIPEAGTFAASKERRELLATSKDVSEALGKGTQIVDGRPEHQYLGLGRRTYVTAPGHLPGAINLQPDTLVVDPKNGLKASPFYTVDMLKKLVAAKGIDLSKPTITYCDTGHLGAGTWFLLSEILGAKNVALYDGSMHAWSKPAERQKQMVGLGR